MRKTIKKYEGVLIYSFATLLFLGIALFYLYYGEKDDKYIVVTYASLFGIVNAVIWKYEDNSLEAEREEKRRRKEKLRLERKRQKDEKIDEALKGMTKAIKERKTNK